MRTGLGSYDPHRAAETVSPCIAVPMYLSSISRDSGVLGIADSPTYDCSIVEKLDREDGLVRDQCFV